MLSRTSPFGLKFMKKPLKYGLIALDVTGVLLALLLALVSLVIDPNDFKPQIVKMVKEKKQRTLTLVGDIKLTFFPGLGLDLGRASISEYRSDTEFAAVDNVRLYLSWWPLLRKELVVDQVRVRGIRANLVRFKDGTTNFDDLLQKEEEDKQIKFDIDSVAMDQGALSFRDEMAGRKFTLSDIRINTGRLANNKPTEFSADFMLQSDTPQNHANIHATSGLTFDTGTGRYTLKGLNLELRGTALGLNELAVGLKGDVSAHQKTGTLLAQNLALAVAGKMDARDFDVRVIAPRLQWTAVGMATEKIDLVAKMQLGSGYEASMVASLSPIADTRQSFTAALFKAEVRADYRDMSYLGEFSSSLSGNLGERQFSLPALKGRLTADNAKTPGKHIKLDVSGTAQLDLPRQRATANLAALLDESNIRIRADVSPLNDPHIALDLDIDRIDADRYLTTGTAQGANRQEKPFDFLQLKTLNASGNVRIGSLMLNGIKARNARLEFKPDSLGK